MSSAPILAGLDAPAMSPWRDRLLAAWAASGAILPCLMPNFGAAIVGLSMIAPALLADRTLFLRSLAQTGPLSGVLAAIVLYLCFNAAFAPVTDNAVGAIATVAIAGLACHVCAAAFPAVARRDLRVMARGFAIGALLVAVFLCAEYITRMSMLRTLQGLAEHANIRSIRLDAGTWKRPAFTHLSRNLVVLIMLTWPAIAFIGSGSWTAARRAAMAAMLLLVLISALLSPSATAKAGLIAGVAGWLLTHYAARMAAVLVTTGWIVASLACIPISHAIHKVRLYEVDWLGASLRHRMMIWSASAEWFWQHPFAGLGIGGARKVNLNDGLNISAPGIEAEPLNWHAHNIFVQAWFETGAIGGLLLCLFGLLVLREIFRLPQQIRPYAVATFVSIFVICLTGFSLWAAWYLSGFALAALCILLAVFAHREEAPLPPTGAR